MKQNLTLTLILTLSLLFACFATAQTPATNAADKPLPERLPLEKAELGRPTMKDLDHGKKLTGRLPNGYRNVVTSSQRDQIYAIQKEYTNLIELLKLRIKLMEMERDQKIDALLTKEQAAMIRKDLGVLESEKHLQRGEGNVVSLEAPKPAAAAQQPAPPQAQVTPVQPEPEPAKPAQPAAE